MTVTNGTGKVYRGYLPVSLSNNTIITSSSDKRECTKCSTRKAFPEKLVVELVYKFDE